MQTGAANDPCSDVTWSDDFTSWTLNCGAGSTTVTFTATNACGGASTTQATFTAEGLLEIDTPAANEVVDCNPAANLGELSAWLAANGGVRAQVYRRDRSFTVFAAGHSQQLLRGDVEH